MSTFSIAGADDDDDFAELINAKSNANAAPASGKAGAVETPVAGAVPLKTPAPAKGESVLTVLIIPRQERAKETTHTGLPLLLFSQLIVDKNSVPVVTGQA